MKRWLAALVLVPAALGADAQVQQPPPVQFEARADLILVDANVVDGKGVPIGDLTADDFVVSVDGQPRPIASVQFVTSNGQAPPVSTATHYSSNEGVSAGRRLLLAVDENSIPPGGARAVLFSVDRLLKDLSPADRIAFIRLPTFEGSVDFTTDRPRIAEAVKRVLGSAHPVGSGKVSIAEAVSYDRRDGFAWDAAIARHCGTLSGPDQELCTREAEGEATEMLNTYLRRARETLTGIGRILANVRQVPGPKTLVLLSQGFLTYDYRMDVMRLAEQAAAANVSVYALHIDMPAFDIAAFRPSMTRADDEQLMATGIDDLAGASRGTRFRIVGSGETIFGRVARELSGYYLIALKPTESDRDGKPHRIKVDVKRPNVTVRARAQFTIGAVTAETMTATRPGDRLLELLRAAAPEEGVPLRLAAFTMPAATPDRVKVIITADVGPPIDKPVSVHVGFVLVDARGKVAGSELSTVTLVPAEGGQPSAPRYLGNVEVPRGDYTLRLAAIAPDGHTGSVHHALQARVHEAGGVSVSDLILAVPSRGRAGARPEVHISLESQALQAAVELAVADPQRLKETRVNFEVTDTIDGTPLVQARGTIRPGEGPVKPAAAILDVGVLPPGPYIARAVVTVPGEKPISTTRPFEIAPRRRRVAVEAPDAERSVPRAPARGRMRPPIPPFRKDEVLAPAVVNPFIDHVLEHYAPSPAAREALNAIKAGDLQNATKGERQVGDLGLSFAQGLVLLAADRPAEADAYFRAALRSSSDFIGAAFYLGATLAAGGKDRDAVGAWKTALIGEVGAAGVYPVLVDGLLRLRDGEQALEVLQEAEPTFVDRDEYSRRLVQAYALLGRVDEALPVAHDYLSRHPGDADMLFLTMHMIYEGQAAGELANSQAELERFSDYAATYAAAGGTQGTIVQGWRKALGIR